MTCGSGKFRAITGLVNVSPTTDGAGSEAAADGDSDASPVAGVADDRGVAGVFAVAAAALAVGESAPPEHAASRANAASIAAALPRAFAFAMPGPFPRTELSLSPR